MYRLTDLYVKVLYPWPIKEAPRRISQLTQRFRSEKSNVKSRLAVSWIGVDLERTGRNLRRIEQLVVHAVAERPQQRPVGIVEKRDRESGAEAGGARNTESFLEVVVVGGHEILGQIERRDDPGRAFVERIDLFAQIRRVIDRF